MNRVVAFDAWGAYGHFRKPYAPLSPSTFPFPPPPTVMGLVGAICGMDKDTYHEALDWEQLGVGVRLLAPTTVFRTSLNLLNTKYGTDRYFRPSRDAARIQIPYEFLKNPRFRMYVTGAPDPVMDDLARRLKDNRPAYTPTLGLANCLAEVELVADDQPEELPPGKSSLGTVVPLGEDVKIHYHEASRPVQRFRVPASMDGDRVVHRYQEVIVATDAGPLLAEGVQGYRLGDDAFCFI